MGGAGHHLISQHFLIPIPYSTYIYTTALLSVFQPQTEWLHVVTERKKSFYKIYLKYYLEISSLLELNKFLP